MKGPRGGAVVARPSHAPLSRRRRARRGLRGHVARVASGGIPADRRSRALSRHSSSPAARLAGTAARRRSAPRAEVDRRQRRRRRRSCCGRPFRRPPASTGCSHSSRRGMRSHSPCTRGRMSRSAGSGGLSTSPHCHRARTVTSWSGSPAPGTSSGSGTRRRPSIDSLFGERRRPLVGHVWARHLWDVRECTVVERHLEQWLGAVRGTSAGEGGRGYAKACPSSVRTRRRRDTRADAQALGPGCRRLRSNACPNTTRSGSDERATPARRRSRVADRRRRDDRDRRPRLDLSDRQRQRCADLGGASPPARPGDELTAKLVDAYGIDADTAAADVERFLNELREREIAG